jgi:hypothetical protein
MLQQSFDINLYAEQRFAPFGEQRSSHCPASEI